MTKIIILLILSIFSLYTQASTVVFSDNLKFDNCDAPKDLPVVLCKEGSKRAIIQLDQKGHLVGLVHGENGVESFAVKQILEGERPVYYNTLSDKINEEQVVTEFETPLTRMQQLTLRRSVLSRTIKEAENLDSRYLDELKYFQYTIDNEVRNMQIDLSNASSLLWVNTDKGGNVNCSMETRCPIKKCGDNSYFIFDPSKNIYMPISFSRDSRGNARFTKNDPAINFASTLSGKILTANDHYLNSRLTSSRKAPLSLQNNTTAYFSLQDGRFGSYLRSIISKCSEDIKKDLTALGFQTNEERQKMDLVHLVEVINGSINSQYINKKFLPSNSCRDGDSYYTAESYRASQEFRPRSSGIISWKKAKELFDKAKNMKNLAWENTTDGCYARAELMVNMMEEEGVVADKAWSSGYLKSSKSLHPWAYHVAPVVYINNGRGQVEKMIIDPSVADGPVTPDVWLAKMGVREKNLDQVGFPPSLDALSFGRNTFAIADRRTFHPEDKTLMSKEKRTRAAEQVLKALSRR